MLRGGLNETQKDVDVMFSPFKFSGGVDTMKGKYSNETFLPNNSKKGSLLCR